VNGVNETGGRQVADLNSVMVLMSSKIVTD